MRPVDGHVQGVGHQARDPVDVRVAQAQGTADVADRCLGAHGAEGDDLGHAVAAVAARDELQHFLAPVVRQVEVHVGRLRALLIEEALEDQVGAKRVEVGDAEAVEHQAGGGAASHADADAA